jgi:DNA-directed RNA polymerase beta' subunit
VFNISRTTISGNTRLKINQVGIPVAFAKVLQVEEIVQEYNLPECMRYFLNGKRAHPGCSRIMKQSTGETYDVDGLRRDFQLEIGDTIYRDLIDGDPAYFNRQPTLEKSSIGVHEIVILHDPACFTFQMNVSACENYNADKIDVRNRWLPC